MERKKKKERRLERLERPGARAGRGLRREGRKARGGWGLGRESSGPFIKSLLKPRADALLLSAAAGHPPLSV